MVEHIHHHEDHGGHTQGQEDGGDNGELSRHPGEPSQTARVIELMKDAMKRARRLSSPNGAAANHASLPAA